MHVNSVFLDNLSPLQDKDLKVFEKPQSLALKRNKV